MHFYFELQDRVTPNELAAGAQAIIAEHQGFWEGTIIKDIGSRTSTRKSDGGSNRIGLNQPTRQVQANLARKSAVRKARLCWI